LTGLSRVVTVRGMASRDIASVSSRWPDTIQGPWHITSHFGIVNGRRECVGLDVRSFKEAGEGEGKRKVPLRPGASYQVVTASVIRSLPVATLVRSNRQGLADIAAHVAADPATSAENREMLTERAAELRSSTRRLYDAEHFAQVAAIYSKAWEAGDAPTRAVAEQMKATRSAAAKWVARARQLGMLGKTDQRVAGGVSPRPPKRG
jgi:hypothetical protein